MIGVITGDIVASRKMGNRKLWLNISQPAVHKHLQRANIEGIDLLEKKYKNQVLQCTSEKTREHPANTFTPINPRHRVSAVPGPMGLRHR